MSGLHCPVARRCGGCQFTDLSYAEQLQRKQRRMEDLLSRFGPVQLIRGMAEPFHYRNKVHASLSVDKRGLPVSGVYAEGSHRVVPVSDCRIQDSRANQVIRDIVGMMPAFRMPVYNEYNRRGFLRHILIRTGAFTGEMLVVLVVSSLQMPGKHAFVQALLEKHPEITSLVLNQNNRHTSMVLGQRETVLSGPGYLEDRLCGKRFRISPQSFYQVNARQAEVLYRLAVEAAGLTGKETLLDAYCGTGTIGLCAADGAARLIGVELNPAAVKDAKENARLNGVSNASFHCEDAGRFMQRMSAKGERPDVVIMDPPRSGSTEAFLSALCQTAPERVVYVSCGPDTLARDLAYLTDHGYRMTSATPVDMFPWTDHVETVCCLYH